MAYEFVDPPHGLSYAAPAVDFGILGDLPSTYRKAQEQKRQEDIATTFKDGMPIDPATGQPDIRKAMDMLARRGFPGAIGQLGPLAIDQQLRTQAAQTLGGPASTSLPDAGGAAPPPGPSLTPSQGAPAAPQSMPAQPANATGGYTPMQNAPNSVIGIVGSQIPQSDEGFFKVAQNAARSAGVNPNDMNAPLTPEQQAKVTQFANAAARSRGGGQVQSAPLATPVSGAPGTATPDQMADARRRLAAQMAPPGDRVAAGFDAAGAPTARAQASPEDVRAAPQAAPPQAAPPQTPARPIFPQEPLPTDPATGRPFNDPYRAADFLENMASRMVASNPNLAEAAKRMEAKAKRIRDQVQPHEVSGNTTLIDDKGNVVYRGQRSVILSPSDLAAMGWNQRTIDAAARTLNDTGRLPTNLGTREFAGQISGAIQNRAAELWEDSGKTIEERSQHQQEFRAQQVAIQRFRSGPQSNTIRSLDVVVDHLATLRGLSDALKNGDIRLFNQIAQRWASETGSAAPTNMDMASQIVGTEVIKALGVAGAGTKDEREELAAAFRKTKSPEQMYGAIGTAQKLLTGQMKGMRRQFVVATGLPEDKFDLALSPATREFLGQHGASETAAPGAGTSEGGDKGWTPLPNGMRYRQVGQ